MGFWPFLPSRRKKTDAPAQAPVVADSSLTFEKPLLNYDEEQKRLFKAIRQAKDGDALKIISEIILTWPEMINKEYSDPDRPEKSYRDVTPLVASIEAGRFDIFMYLVSLGANISQKTNYRTPMSAAAEYGAAEVARYLIQKEACIDETSHHYINDRYDDMISPREIALRRNNSEIVGMIDSAKDLVREYKHVMQQRPKDVPEDVYMKQMRETRKSFFQAIKDGNLDGIETAIHFFKYALMWKDDKGMKPLHVAYISGRIDSFNFLVAMGADPNESLGAKLLPKPVHLAVRDGDIGFLQYLLKIDQIKLDMPGMTLTLEDYAESLGRKEIAGLIRAKKIERGEITPAAQQKTEESLQMPATKAKAEQRIEFLEGKLKEAFDKIERLEMKIRNNENPPPLRIEKRPQDNGASL